MEETDQDELPSAWCVVANVKHVHQVGEGGSETQIGTRLFRAGAKVYIVGCYPGICESVVCIGLHRKSGKFITTIIKVWHLENFRAKVVYNPEVVRRMFNDKRCWFRTEEDAIEYAIAFPKWQAISRPGINSSQS